jgi:uncharacterized protein
MKLYKIRYFLHHILAIAFVLVSSVSVLGQKDIPARPNPPRLVNDFASLLTPQEQSQLEHKLVAFNDTTSTQIAVVVVKTLNDYDIADMAVRIMTAWGIGQKGKNNGILVLVKTKSQEEKGKVFITTGYGVESFVTDALSKRIVEREILPSFRENQYYQGLDKATSVLMSLVKGQFTVDQYMKKKSKKRSGDFFWVIIIIVIAVIVVLKGKSNGGNHYSSGGTGSLPFWLLLGSMMGGNRSGGYGDFSSGGGDFGSDDGGGFGGFGGGSGGGGGAGGEW